VGGSLIAAVRERKSGRPRIRCPAIADQLTIDAVRGGLDDATAQRLRAFWAQHGALDGDAATRRLAEVVCVLRGPDGSLAGAASVFPTDLPLIGNRRFYVLRTLLPGLARERFFDVFATAYEVLDAEYDGVAEAPIGLCALLEEPERRARPEAEWLDPRTIYAGYLGDGRQVRLAYFSAAVSASTWPVPPDYDVVPFATQDMVSADDVIAMWTAEGALPAAEARRRVDELLFVATDREGALAGVSTRYLHRNEQLGMDLWHFRVFVAQAFRKSFVATSLAVLGREYLRDAYVSGRDTRAPGLIYEVESPILKQFFPNAVWFPADVIYIGDSPHGAHVRVHYFPGAVAPEPSFS
jgi:hypothetical protein